MLECGNMDLNLDKPAGSAAIHSKSDNWTACWCLSFQEVLHDSLGDAAAQCMSADNFIFFLLSCSLIDILQLKHRNLVSVSKNLIWTHPHFHKGGFNRMHLMANQSNILILLITEIRRTAELYQVNANSRCKEKSDEHWVRRVRV